MLVFSFFFFFFSRYNLPFLIEGLGDIGRLSLWSSFSGATGIAYLIRCSGNGLGAGGVVSYRGLGIYE